MKDDHRVKDRLCLKCGYVITAATGVEGQPPRAPEPDDIAICLNCGAVMLFTTDSVRWPNDDERAEVMGDPYVRKAVDSVQTLDRENPSYWCMRCHHRSYNPTDVRRRYCGFCHQFEDADA